MKRFKLTREVTVEECPWLCVNLPAGTIVYESFGYDYGCTSEAGVSVTLAAGEYPFMEVPETAIEEVSIPAATPEPFACGAGKGAAACIFLAIGADGFECARYTGMHSAILKGKGTMTAQRQPTEDWPACMEGER